MAAPINATKESPDLFATTQAEALFASGMSASTDPTLAEVRAAIRQALCAHGGTRGCAGEVAATFGDYPEVAVPRMRWARRVVRSTLSASQFQGRRSRCGT
jgi:hypothetical protein